MTTLKDFLIWYNNKDVVPFIEALKTQINFYHQTLNLDMLKVAIGVPGMCLHYLFKTIPPDTYFSLMGEQEKELHTLCHSSLTGGPSIVFMRRHEKDKTFIRNDPTKPCQSMIGYDCNALYLWCLMQEMPTEHPIIRRRKKNFKMEKKYVFGGT